MTAAQVAAKESMVARAYIVSDETYEDQSGSKTATLLLEQDAASAHHASGDEVPREIYVSIDINCGTLSDDNSAVNSNKNNNQECEKNQLNFDDDTVPMSNDNCTITNPSSTLSYDSAEKAHNEIEIYNITDDVIYNVPLPKCKRIATETPASIYTTSTIRAVQSKRVLRVLFDSRAIKTMIKRSVLPRGVNAKLRKHNTSKVMKTLAGTFALQLKQ